MVEITEKGKYVLTRDYSARQGSCRGGILKKGTILTITQIDEMGKKVIGPELGDWNPNYMPVKKIKDARQDNIEL